MAPTLGDRPNANANARRIGRDPVQIRGRQDDQFVLRKRASNPPCRVRMTIDDRRMADHKYPAEPDDPANDG